MPGSLELWHHAGEQLEFSRASPEVDVVDSFANAAVAPVGGLDLFEEKRVVAQLAQLHQHILQRGKWKGTQAATRAHTRVCTKNKSAGDSTRTRSHTHTHTLTHTCMRTYPQCHLVPLLCVEEVMRLCVTREENAVLLQVPIQLPLQCRHLALDHILRLQHKANQATPGRGSGGVVDT